MVLRKLGSDIDQNAVFDASGLDPALARGCYAKDLYQALKALGFAPGKGWHEIPASGNKQLSAQFRSMVADLKAGIPSIVCMHYDESPKTTEHFRLILGYDGETREVIYHEPATDDGAYQRMNVALFLRLWPLKTRRGTRTLVRFRMKPVKIAAPKKRGSFSNAAYAQHIMKLRKDYPFCKKMTILVEPPFVIVGDQGREMVERRAKYTVRWAVHRLKKAYFTKDPNRILTIWLLGTKKSYQETAKGITGNDPGTPYGFFSSRTNSLIMNIATGGGTLVHEIVHPFVEANFPNCPAWLNEGLGSLYEQAADRDGEIVGLVNWRLPNLQKRIRQGGFEKDKLPTFEKLTGFTDAEFYNASTGNNYAQSRYLCYYLQQKKLLRKFYAEFHKNQTSDPTGYKTLKRILKAKDMKKFQKDWEQYVLSLNYTPS